MAGSRSYSVACRHRSHTAPPIPYPHGAACLASRLAPVVTTTRYPGSTSHVRLNLRLSDRCFAFPYHQKLLVSGLLLGSLSSQSMIQPLLSVHYHVINLGFSVLCPGKPSVSFRPEIRLRILAPITPGPLVRGLTTPYRQSKACVGSSHPANGL